MSTEASTGMPPVLPPPWAEGWGEDRWGVYADVPISSEVALRLRWIGPGSFKMGSAEDEVDRYEDEGPLHEVRITRGYWLGEAPVTQEQWDALHSTNPSRFRNDMRPVEQVNWYDCVEFCDRLNLLQSGLETRLPTETEWEYACRGVRNASYHRERRASDIEDSVSEIEKLGWFAGNSGGMTHDVKQRLPNGFGVYDMRGNVWEWCADWWVGRYSAQIQVDPVGPKSGSLRVVRGGSYLLSARECRCSVRAGRSPVNHTDDVGFRIAIG